MQDDNWPVEECKRVRNDFKAQLEASGDWMGEYEVSDPITPEFIASLQDENERFRFGSKMFKDPKGKSF